MDTVTKAWTNTVLTILKRWKKLRTEQIQSTLWQQSLHQASFNQDITSPIQLSIFNHHATQVKKWKMWDKIQNQGTINKDHDKTRSNYEYTAMNKSIRQG